MAPAQGWHANSWSVPNFVLLRHHSITHSRPNQDPDLEKRWKVDFWSLLGATNTWNNDVKRHKNVNVASRVRSTYTLCSLQIKNIKLHIVTDIKVGINFMLGFRISTFGWGKGLVTYKEKHNTVVCNLSRYFKVFPRYFQVFQALLALPPLPCFSLLLVYRDLEA